MDVQLQDLIKLYKFTVGRRLFALKGVLKQAKALVLEDIAGKAEEAIAHDRRVLELEQLWRAQRGPAIHGYRAKNLDNRLDRALSGLDTALQSALSLYGEDEDPGPAARLLREAIFPDGVQAYTRLNFVEQHERTNELLERLQSPPLQGLADQLALGGALERIALINRDYGQELNTRKREYVRFGEVRRAREEGQALLLELVAVILGRFPGRNEEHSLARHRVLSPILEQNRDIGAGRSRRRPLQDIDPETGDELEDSWTESDEEAGSSGLVSDRGMEGPSVL